MRPPSRTSRCNFAFATCQNTHRPWHTVRTSGYRTRSRCRRWSTLVQQVEVLGWVIGGVLPAALATDWLTSAWQQNACLTPRVRCRAVEEVVGEWLKTLSASHNKRAFLSPAARWPTTSPPLHAMLSKRWDVESQGLHGAPPIRVSCEQRTSWFVRARTTAGFACAYSLLRLTIREDCSGELAEN